MKKPKHLRLALLGAAFFAGGMALPALAQAPAPAPARNPAAPAGPLATPSLAPVPVAPAPAAAPDPDQAAVVQLVAEIAAQQAKIVENQKQIDARLATVKESLRIARIYVSRGGGSK